MKNIIFLLAMFLVMTSVKAQFITTWNTETDSSLAGTSNDTSITIPTTGGDYDYDVDWN
ncbi:MAG: hypothetical protein IIB06_10670, partial [Bacteroidetes bacterium]|nr:hypothetical protein [Bacteroidota bacterium]